MELRDLRLFVCVVDERSFSAAGRRLHFAQSVVSQAVARLEHELGGRLLERSRDGSTPTAQGIVLLRWARHLITAADRAVEDVRAATATTAATIRIGLLPTITPLVLPGLLSGLQARPTPIPLRVTEGLAPLMLQQVRNGQLDLAVLFFPIEQTTQVHFVEVGQRPLCVIVGAGAQLARRSSVPLRALAHYAWITFPPHNPGRLWLDTACAEAGFIPHIAAEVETITQQQIFVEAGMGLAMVPMGSMAHSISGPGIAQVPLDTSLPSFRIGYCYAPGLAGPGIEVASQVLESLFHSDSK